MNHHFLFLGLLTASLVNAAAATDSSIETHPLSPHGRVQVENENGSISIRTWDRDEVSIHVEKNGPNEAFLRAIVVKIESEPDSLTITTKMPKYESSWRDWIDGAWGNGDRREVQLTLIVPATAELGKIASINGSIALAGAHSLVRVSTVNGSIHAAGLHEGVLKTVNGSIQAEMDQLGANAQLVVSTVNGAVTLRLPKNIGAGVNLSTVNGRISCDLPLEGETDVSRNRLVGVIGAGGGSINVKCINGAVHLRAL